MLGCKMLDFKQFGLFLLLLASVQFNAQSQNSTSKNQTLLEDLSQLHTPLTTTDSSRFYVRSAIGEPWTQTNQYSNVGIMDAVFGTGGWTQAYFESTNIEELFGEDVSIIFIDGGDDGAIAFQEFLSTYKEQIEDWVSDGGRLLLNAAPNEGGDIQFGFDNTVLNYGPNYITHVETVDSNHWVLNGPAQPVHNSYIGDFFAHAFISGEQLEVILKDSSSLELPVLAEKFWGDGLVLFGGMTSTQWHLPLTEALHFKMNLLSYMEGFQPCNMELLCPDNLVVELGSTCCSTNVYFDEPFLEGNCFSEIIQTSGDLSGADYSLGTTLNVYEAINEFGDTLNCSFEILVLNPNDPTGNGEYFSINGVVHTENDKRIDGATVSVNGGYLSSLTDTDGAYSFESQILKGSTVGFEVNYEDFLTNGVTTYDLTIITKHILGIEALDSPYKMIAADVNNSKTITTLDLIHIRRAILQQIQEFPGKDAWMFIPADQDIDLSNPWAYNEDLIIDNIQADQAVDFIAIKVGDVSNSANFNSQLVKEED